MIEIEIFLSVVKGYRSVANSLLEESEQEALHGCFGNWLQWLSFNLNRSLKNNIQQNEFSLALQQINYTLNSLQILNKNFDAILSCLSAGV